MLHVESEKQNHNKAVLEKSNEPDDDKNVASGQFHAQLKLNKKAKGNIHV